MRHTNLTQTLSLSLSLSLSLQSLQDVQSITAVRTNNRDKGLPSRIVPLNSDEHSTAAAGVCLS